MKKVILFALLVSSNLLVAQGSMGEVVGTFISKKDKSPIVNARIQTVSNGTLYGSKSDLDGRFRVSAMPPGEYVFKIIIDGDTIPNIAVKVPMDGIVNLGNIELKPKVLSFDAADVRPDIIPSLTYGVASEIKMDREQIKRSPGKFNQNEMIAAMTSDIKVADDGSLVFRGARKGDMIYMMDGVKMNEVTNLPSAAIGGLMVYTGGIPAKYGDTLGGVVVMESLGYFDLYRAWEAQQIRNSKD
jgi:hypothetical protein